MRGCGWGLAGISRLFLLRTFFREGFLVADKTDRPRLRQLPITA
jgi:hypothetical protein